MIEKIKHKKQLFALIEAGISKKGISFFTDNKAIQQFDICIIKRII